MELILHLYDQCKDLIDMGMPMSYLKQESIFDDIIAIKYDVPNAKLSLFRKYWHQVDHFHDEVIAKNA